MPPKPDPREDHMLHDAVRTGILAGRIELKTDGLHLHKTDSPVYNAWDNLGPLLVMMTGSLLILLFKGLAFGLAAMTAVILIYIFGMRWWVSLQVQRRTLEAVLRNVHNWDLVWRFGGVALVRKGALERPYIAPRDDWRVFARQLIDAPSAEMPEEIRESEPQ